MSAEAPDTRPTLVVSPHLDDALLSAYALVRSPGAAVLNVFTATPQPAVSTEWDRSCGFADSTQAMHARSAEDATAFDGWHVERWSLGLLETEYQPVHSAGDQTALIDAVHRWRGETGGLVAMPVGAGREYTWLDQIRFRIPVPGIGRHGGSPPHPDHVWVTETLLGHLPAADILLYEDLPYAWLQPGDRAAAALARRMNANAAAVTLPVDGTDKGRRVVAYRSQMAGVFARWVRHPQRYLNAAERHWRLVPRGTS